jgi:N-dimethylarginine dimethylaminohydrolase
MGTLTAHSEYGEIKSLILKPANSAFISTVKIDAEWETLRYLAAPDWSIAGREYQYFQSIFELFNAEIIQLPPDPALSLDSIYCRDAAIATDYGMIFCNMGKAARTGEPLAVYELALMHDIPVLGTIQSPGTLEGGDVAWLDRQTLVAGHSYRTNLAGIRQLQDFLLPYGVSVMKVDLPHYKGPQDVFHLMSIFSPIAADVAVVFSPLMPIAFRDYLLKGGFTLVEVPESEFESLGCNVLAVAPGICLMAEGNPVTKKALEDYGFEVNTYEGTEISFKGGGGPTCLTRPLLRSI